jgi:hypothetical protein
MSIVQLHAAELEKSESLEMEKMERPRDPPAASKGSFNLLDNIKQASSKSPHGKHELNSNPTPSWKGEPTTRVADRLEQGFTSITESLSNSSEELTNAVKETFSLFKTSSSHPDPLSLEESRLDNNTYDDSYDEWAAAFTARTGDSLEHHRRLKQTPAHRKVVKDEETLMSPSERAFRILDNLKTNETTNTEDEHAESVSSPLHSVESEEERTTYSWEEDSAEDASRDVSLLDTDEAETPGLTFDDDDDTFSKFDSPMNPVESFLDELAEAESIQALGGIVYKLGTCSFRGMEKDVDYEDDYTIMSDVFDQQPGTGQQLIRGRSMSPRPLPTVGRQPELDDVIDAKSFPPPGTPDQRNRGFFEAMFSCGGQL